MSDLLATPRHIDQGTRDLSMKPIRPVLKRNPQFVPNFKVYTPKGDYRPHHVVGSELIHLFGLDTIRPTSPYANHANLLMGRIIQKSGASVVVQRLRPLVNGTPAPIANRVFYLVRTDGHTAKVYQRDEKGHIVRDAAGNPVYTDDDVTVEYVGVVSRRASELELETNGITVETETYTVDGTDYTVTFTPIFVTSAEGHGSYYNNIGISLEPYIGIETDQALKEKARTLAYRLRVFDKSTGFKDIGNTATGSPDIKFTFRPYSSDPITNRANGLTDLFPGEYGNYIDPKQDFKPYIFSETKMPTEEEFNAALKGITVREYDAIRTRGVSPLVGALSDFVIEPNVDPSALFDKYMYMANILTLTNTSTVEYEGVRPLPQGLLADIVQDGYDAVVGNRNIPTYLMGGVDGDVTDLTGYENAVTNEFKRYADPDDIVNNIALNKDTVFIDSGFKMDTKVKIAPYISNRQDTFAVFATKEFDKDNRILSIDEELGRANMLKTILAMYTESKAFSTPTMRAAILMGDGILEDRISRYRMPMTFDWSVKAARYYGGLDGNWNPVFDFSTQDANKVTELIDVEPKFIPPGIKDRLWSAGLVYVEPDDEGVYYYPGQQTIYPYDNSIFNSIRTVIAACTIHRVNDKLHRLYTGETEYTDTELKIAVERDCKALLKGRFDKGISISPEVFYLRRDEDLGWVWRLRVELYANNMKTVMYSEVDGYRRSAATQTNDIVTSTGAM